MYSNGGHSFRLYVNGAVGAKMEGAGTSVVKISTAWAGAEGSYAFGQMAGLGQAQFVTTDYHNGDVFFSSVLSGTTVQNVVAAGAPLGVVVYELHREGGTLPAAQIKAAERPRFKFNSISTLGVFIDDQELDSFYYLAPPGTPTFKDGDVNHGYYKLYLLENLEMQAKGGWVD